MNKKDNGREAMNAVNSVGEMAGNKIYIEGGENKCVNICI